MYPVNNGLNQPYPNNFYSPQMQPPTPPMQAYPQIQNGTNLQRPMLPGRMINDVNEIRPNEVPMDGSVSLFPTSDFSCVYIKAWNTDGTIRTIRYVPESVMSPNQESNSINSIMDRLDKIERSLSKKQYNKKEGNGNEQHNEFRS